ncbi:translation initiation factor eIF4A [Actinomortierella wolfii]|nr:translation initiation factor eIF4A [Actinomortierella wolfii]
MDTFDSPRPASAPPRTGDTTTSPSAATSTSATRPAKNSKSSNPSATSDSASSPSHLSGRKSKNANPKGSPSSAKKSRPQDKQGDGASTAPSDTSSVGLGVSAGTATTSTSTDTQDSKPATSKEPGSTQTSSAPSPKSSGRKETAQAPAPESASSPSSLGQNGVARENGNSKPHVKVSAASANETNDTPKAAAAAAVSSPSVASAKTATEDSETDLRKSQKSSSAKSQRASAKQRKGQQQSTAAEPSEPKAVAMDSGATEPGESTIDTSTPTPSRNEASSPLVNDATGGTATKKRKEKRKPAKRGGPSSAGDDATEVSSTSTETQSLLETPSATPQTVPQPGSGLATAATAPSTEVDVTSSDTAGRATSERPAKKIAPAAPSPSITGDASDGSEVQQAASPRPGRGGKTKSSRPLKEKLDRSSLKQAGTTTEEKSDGSTATERRAARPPRGTKESPAKDTTTVSESAATPDISAENVTSTNRPNERPARERGSKPSRHKADTTTQDAEQKEADSSKTVPEEGAQQDETQQTGRLFDSPRGRFSDRGGRSSRGGLSRVFSSKNGQSSLDARAARQEANRRERELRRQQEQSQATQPEVETTDDLTEEKESKSRGKDSSAKPPRPENDSKQPLTADATRGTPEKSRHTSLQPSDKKEADVHGSWREAKAHGTSSRFGSSIQRPPHAERKEGFGSGPRVWKDAFFANSMICYMTWEEMRLRPDVIECIHRYGLKHPSNVQKLALVPFGEGKDIIAQAQSQNDRTNTFAIGALQKLKKDDKSCQAAVICSDRVQPHQVYKDLERWFEGTGLSCVMLNETPNEELKRYRESTTTGFPHVVVTTLGRLTEVVESELLDMNTIETVGICMAQHELVDFEAFKKLWAKLSRKAQVVLLTGIMLPKLRSIKMQNFRRNTVVLRADELTLKWSQHYVIRLESQEQKWQTLVDIFQKNKTITHTVIVTLSNSMTQLLVSRLKEHGIPAHGVWSMADKVQMAELFNKPDDCVLVVESALTAELDLDHDSLVINYEMPWKASYYISIFGLFGRSGLRTMMINMMLKDKPNEVAMLEELETLYDIKIADMKPA